MICKQKRSSSNQEKDYPLESKIIKKLAEKKEIYILKVYNKSIMKELNAVAMACLSNQYPL